MGYSKVALLLALLLCSAMPALIYIPGVQIDPLMLYQVQVACDRLQNTLRLTYGTVYQNDIDNYVKTFIANYFLKMLASSPQLAPYSNVIAGTNNTVNGARSIVVGNNNNVAGVGNFVFSRNFDAAATGNTGGDLVLDEWNIKLAMLQDANNFLAYLNNPKAYIFRW